MNTLLVAATSAFLLIAPFPGSAGLRATMLLLAAIALFAVRAVSVLPHLSSVPRGAALAFTAWALLAIASLAWSRDRAYTLSELRPEVLYAAITLVVFFFAAQETAHWCRWRLAILAGALAALAAQWLHGLLPFPLTGHPWIDQGGPWSTHLVLVAPLLLALGWPRPWGAARGPAMQAIAIALLLYAAWETDNRIVWAALGAELLVVIALAPAAAGPGACHLRRMAAAAGLVACIAFAAVMVERNTAYFGPGAPISRSLEHDVRPRIWSAAWESFAQAPWVGHGFGREILAPAFAPLTPELLHRPDIRHGHNLFVDLALQLGVAGLAAFAALLLALAREYARLLRRPECAALGVMGLALLAGFLVKNLTDDFLHRHNALVFWALNAMLVGLGRATPPAAVEPRSASGAPGTGTRAPSA